MRSPRSRGPRWSASIASGAIWDTQLWLGRRLAADAIDYSGAIAIVVGLSAASGLWVAFDMPSAK